MSDWLAIILLGLIEGITEFLPISSTGHLLLAEHLKWLPPQSDLFNVVIQCGAVIAVLPLFPDRCRQLLQAGRDPLARDYFLKLAAAFVLTGIGGVWLEKHNFKLPLTLPPVGWALLIGGCLFVAVERWLRGKELRDSITWPIAAAVGLGQLVAAVFPGASRSGTTILLMLLMGIKRPLATEFSFLVGIPTMLSAGGLKIFKALHAAPGGPTEDWGLLVLGTVISGVISFLAVKWLLRYVQSHTFEGFGWYRIGLGVWVLWLW